MSSLDHISGQNERRLINVVRIPEHHLHSFVFSDPQGALGYNIKEVF